MGLIKCVDCGKEFSERIEACPFCGCPIKFSLEAANSTKGPFDGLFDDYEPNRLKKVDVNLLKFKQEMMDIMLPLVENRNKIKTVWTEMTACCRQWGEKVSEQAGDILYTYMNNIMYSLENDIKLDIKLYQEEMMSRLKTYHEMQDHIEYTGLGFSIITNDPVSMFTYSVLNYREAQKQINNQLTAADKYLFDSFSQMDNSDAISDYQLKSLVEDINKTVLILGEMAAAINTLSDNYDFYEKASEYSADEYSMRHEKVFCYLINAYKTSGLAGKVRREDSEEASELAAEDYIIYRPSFNCYYSTGKFEEEILVKYGLRKPETAKTAESDDQAEIYARAEQYENEGKYYSAATEFGKITGYKDALQRSRKLWFEHILNCAPLCVFGHSSLLALTSDGRAMINHYDEKGKELEGYSDILDEDTAWIIADNNDTWKGSYISLSGKLYCRGLSDYKMIDISGILRQKVENIRQYCFYNPVLTVLYKNGDMQCESITEPYSEDDYSWTSKVDRWRNIEKFSMYVTKFVVALDNNGMMHVEGEEGETTSCYKDNIKDFTMSGDVIITIDNDNRLSFFGKQSYHSLASYNECDDIVGIHGKSYYTEDGCVYVEDAIGDLQCKDTTSKRKGAIMRVGEVLLMMDGTVVSDDPAYNVSDWPKMVAIYDYNYKTVIGITASGEVLTAGKLLPDYLNETRSWKLFSDIDTYESEIASFLKEVPKRIRLSKAADMEIKIAELVKKENDLNDQIGKCGLLAKARKSRLQEELRQKQAERERLQEEKKNLEC